MQQKLEAPRGALVGALGEVQDQVIDFVTERVQSLPCGVKAPSPEAALRELLRGRSLYETHAAGVSLAAYQSDLLSLPGDVRGAPFLSDIVGAEALSYLQAFHQTETCRSLRIRCS